VRILGVEAEGREAVGSSRIDEGQYIHPMFSRKPHHTGKGSIAHEQAAGFGFGIHIDIPNDDYCSPMDLMDKVEERSIARR
jgi:hypothetical protein